MSDVPQSPRSVVLIEPHEFGEVGLRKFRPPLDLQQVLVVVMRGILAQIVRAGIDDGVSGLGVDDYELVMDMYGGRAATLLFAAAGFGGGSVLLLLISTALNSGRKPAGVLPGRK